MKNWAQPSLSRDFALLSAAILFILCLISAWVTYTTYDRHHQEISGELEKESIRIERALATEMDSANYMLTSLGRQIVLDAGRDPVRIAQLLKSFDSKGYAYAVFCWISPQQQIIASSNKGVLDKPVDMSDRDYMKRTQGEPWKMIIGAPVQGRVSEHWVIPVAMGLTDYTGRFIGSLVISIDISVLTNRISMLARHDGISFAILSKTLLPLVQVSDDKGLMKTDFPAQKLQGINFAEHPAGLITERLLWSADNDIYYRISRDYPYIILVGYDAQASDVWLRDLLWSRLMQVAAMALFFLTFMWIVRNRVIRPVLDMTNIAASVARGEPYCGLPQAGPVEILALDAQIQRLSDYIAENRRILDELRSRIRQLEKE